MSARTTIPFAYRPARWSISSSVLCRNIFPNLRQSDFMSKTLFLSPPSFDGFDGGAGARYQARREVTSYWYPTWLAQPAALTPNSRLLDCPPHDVDVAKCLAIAKDFDHVIINTSTPSLKNDCKVAE